MQEVRTADDGVCNAVGSRATRIIAANIARAFMVTTFSVLRHPSRRWRELRSTICQEAGGRNSHVGTDGLQFHANGVLTTTQSLKKSALGPPTRHGVVPSMVPRAVTRRARSQGHARLIPLHPIIPRNSTAGLETGTLVPRFDSTSTEVQGQSTLKSDIQGTPIPVMSLHHADILGEWSECESS